MNTTLFATATATTLALGLPAAAQDNPMVGGAPMMPNMTIVENAAQAPSLSTLVTAVEAADLVQVLSNEGPLTVFAPTNGAFDEISESSLEMLLMPENQATLQQILTCHVVTGDVGAADLVSLVTAAGGTAEVETLGGCMLTATVEDETVVLTDENGRQAAVTTADVEQANGVVHVIDAVILPEGLAG